MKALFITGTINDNGGGCVIANRNKQLLYQLLGKTNVEIFKVQRRQESLKSVIERCAFAYVVGMNGENVNSILRKAENMDLVWIDGSCYGTIAKELKQKNYKGHIVTFFHNVEKFFCKRSFVKRLLYPVYNGPLIRSETNAIMYSDDIVTLTERDAAYVKRVNNRSKVTILPSSMEDKMENVNGYVAQTLLVKVKCPQLLFVGSYFYANVNGLSWFIERILPQVNAKLM